MVGGPLLELAKIGRAPASVVSAAQLELLKVVETSHHDASYLKSVFTANRQKNSQNLTMPLHFRRTTAARTRGPRSAVRRAALMLGLVVCGSVVHSRVATAQESALTLGEIAPGAMVTTLDGHEADLSTYLAEKKPVVFEFWATWCPLCKSLEPAMSAARQKYDGKVIFVSVGVPQNQTPEKQREYAKAHGLGGELVFDRDSKAIAAYKANHTSYMVVVDSARKVVYVGSGAEQDVDAAISKAFPMKEK